MTLVLFLAVVGASPKSADLDPAAVAALDRMTTSVRELTALSVKANVETDEVEDGKKVTHASTIQLTIHRPNRLHAEVQTDRTQRQLFYDGQSFTIWSPRAGYYASAPAPGTLANLVTLAAERYAVELPFAQVFPWEQFAPNELSAASELPAEELGGDACQHFAFRQAGLEWQLWMGKDGLPRKVELGDRRVTYSWERGLLGEASQFTFTPPKDARKIELTERLRQ